MDELNYDKEKWLDPDDRPTKEERIGRKPSLASRTLADGAAGLDDSELLQLVLGDKPRGKISDLLHADPAELVAGGILSQLQAARLTGALELCRRLALHRDERPRLPTASAVWNWVRPGIIGLRREVFCVRLGQGRFAVRADPRQKYHAAEEDHWLDHGDVLER